MTDHKGFGTAVAMTCLAFGDRGKFTLRMP